MLVLRASCCMCVPPKAAKQFLVKLPTLQLEPTLPLLAYSSAPTPLFAFPFSTHFALCALHVGCNLAALICKLSCCAKRRAGKQVLGCSLCHPLALTLRSPPSLTCGDSPSNCRCRYLVSAHLYYNSSQTMGIVCVCICVCVCFQNFMRSRKCTLISYARCAPKVFIKNYNYFYYY